MRTVKQFRVEGEKDGTRPQNKLKNDYPELYEYMHELHSKFNRHKASTMTMGCSYGFYRDIARNIFGEKPKHLIEYGPGFTTLLLHKIAEMADWDMKVYSYECDENWYKILKDNGFDPFGTMELVDLEVVEKENIYFCTYKHDLKKHKNVDYVLIDGPGIVTVNGVRKDNINVNLDLLTSTFNKRIRYDIDGRHNTQVYYRRLFEGSDEPFLNVPM